MKYGLILTCILALGVSGCATKKFVRNSIDPVSQRVETLEIQNKDQAADIDELETAVSRADERAQTADQKAEDAATEAQSANALATEAQQAASNATSVAQEGIAKLDSRLDSLSNYQMVTQETVTFNLASSELSDDARNALDAVAARVVTDAPCVVEVLGFTDTSGDSAYNLALSKRRAEEVVRYLVSQLGIPLRQIQMLGLGSENPAADNDTREGRQLNRRVEVRVFVAGQ